MSPADGGAEWAAEHRRLLCWGMPGQWGSSDSHLERHSVPGLLQFSHCRFLLILETESAHPSLSHSVTLGTRPTVVHHKGHGDRNWEGPVSGRAGEGQGCGQRSLAAGRRVRNANYECDEAGQSQRFLLHEGQNSWGPRLHLGEKSGLALCILHSRPPGPAALELDIEHSLPRFRGFW